MFANRLWSWEARRLEDDAEAFRPVSNDWERHVEERGTVSMWLGHAESEQTLWDALGIQFTEDGEFLGSLFSRAFAIGNYDDSFQEAVFFQSSPTTLEELLRGCSYETAILPRFRQMNIALTGRTNCIVLLYDLRHQGPSDAPVPGLEMRFVGAVSYRD